jgi:eukaryotic-like serine/threonine-protein kinase
VLVAAGLILVMVVAAVIAGRALLGGSSGSRHRAASDTPSASPSAQPGGLPAGFRRYAHPGGFSVAVPQGWTPTQVNNGIVDVQEPGSTRFLRLIRSASTAAARTQLASAEPGFASSHDGYHLLRLDKVSYRSYDAADWEFTYDKSGTLRHVLYRAVAVDGASYGLYLSVPDARWTESRRIFDVAAATFDLRG